MWRHTLREGQLQLLSPRGARMTQVSSFNATRAAPSSQVSEGVSYLNTNTAGGRVRFGTDSPYVAIHAELGIPVKYIGVGETIDDLQKFDADSFVNALFTVDERGAQKEEQQES